MRRCAAAAVPTAPAYSKVRLDVRDGPGGADRLHLVLPAGGVSGQRFFSFSFFFSFFLVLFFFAACVLPFCRGPFWSVCSFVF